MDNNITYSLKNRRKISGSPYIAFLENEIDIPVDLLAIKIQLKKTISKVCPLTFYKGRF
jgi:hypothetical protein